MFLRPPPSRFFRCLLLSSPANLLSSWACRASFLCLPRYVVPSRACGGPSEERMPRNRSFMRSAEAERSFLALTTRLRSARLAKTRSGKGTSNSAWHKRIEAVVIDDGIWINVSLIRYQVSYRRDRSVYLALIERPVMDVGDFVTLWTLRLPITSNLFECASGEVRRGVGGQQSRGYVNKTIAGSNLTVGRIWQGEQNLHN